MKIYIDELPKGCKLGCPYCYHEIKNTYYCAIQNKYIEFFGDDYFKREKDCPLQSLTDYTKKVRKEVCEEFKENIENIEKSIVNNPSYFDNEERKRLVEKAVYKNVFKFLDKESNKQ